jgi:hypothetical protein
MKTVTLAPGKWNQIILALAGAAHQTKDELVAKELHSLIGNIIDGQEDAPTPGPVQRGFVNRFGYNVPADLADCITLDPTGGKYTILAYLTLYHPDYLRSINYKDPQETVRDGLWLFHNANGVTGLAPAPDFFKQFHIHELKTYSYADLRRCFTRASRKGLTSL